MAPSTATHSVYVLYRLHYCAPAFQLALNAMLELNGRNELSLRVVVELCYIRLVIGIAI